MSSQTATGMPYPEPADPNPDPAAALKALAQAIDAYLLASPSQGLDARLAALAGLSGGAFKNALSATFVRFVDLAGNPITAHSVTIKVDTATGEIDDITYQGV